MFAQIMARVPEDNGKVLRYSHTETITVGPDPCEYAPGCEGVTAVIVKGDTDSFGWEPILCCEACLQAIRNYDDTQN